MSETSPARTGPEINGVPTLVRERLGDAADLLVGASSILHLQAGAVSDGMSAPVRGQRRIGTPSLVLPGDPDGPGWWATGGGRYTTFPSPPHRHPAETQLSVRYVGRPSYWGNPWQVTSENGFWQHQVAGEPRPRTFRYQDETSALKWAAIQHRLWVTGLGPVDQAQYVAPLATADVLSCWCPLQDMDTYSCHADILCELVGQLKSGELVPGLVATPDICAGVLRIDGTHNTVGEIVTAWEEWDPNGYDMDEIANIIAGDSSLDPEMVKVAAHVGGAL